MINSKTLLLFCLTAILIVFLEYDFLKPAFKIGLSPEDREFILRYKTFGPNPLTKILEVWSERGAYTTIPIYYIGIVESLTGFNYSLIQFVGIFFRILATLSIFPLILMVFKNRWLASLTTMLFAFSYTTTGALETGVEPSEYLGLLMMNIFLISYYYLNTKYLLKLNWLIFTSLLLFMAVITSVMRVYPILFFLPAVELFLWFINSTEYKFRHLIIKLAVLYLPFLLLKYFSPLSTSGHLALPTILSKIAEGNWHLILPPIEGLGFIISVGKYYDKFGLLELNTLEEYTVFLLGGPLIIFGAIALIVSWLSTKNPLPFLLRLFTLNFGFDVLLYWITQHRLFIPSQLRLNFDQQHIYSVFLGWFILSLAVNYFITWYNQGKNNNLFLGLWLGPLIGLFYITMTYFFSGLELSFGGSHDHYLLIPTIGTSLFIAGILVLLYVKLSILRFRVAGILLIGFIMLALYQLNRQLIYNYFNNANINGRAAVGQIEIQEKAKQKLKLDYSKPILVYFDTSDITGYGPFYSESLLTPFPFFMHLQGEKILDGCIGVIYEDYKMVKLRSLVREANKQLTISYPLICVDHHGLNVKNVPIKLEDLYAYKIKDRDFIDIKDQVLHELELK